ncbi:adenosine kinase-like protein [Leishmania major strain Friedlin]|uniref:Adenosine kinase n=1 Tax=Leishmania major TaxID=5664 RepID=Q4Q7L4_LEIMA|nr:adenosine kinase-like protein [Leishmania major strain Friedlin]CAG9578279.1 adenosine_kinase-like_protein [Leishmania major strain Friedlin]CAJ06064.1 adenosine kinase-like protein [Leishmania major strain Friedlin]|eukprot:XP_001684684.1 adenosine kinase-like protein [Leishmania major strain Friedlin]
MYVGCVGKDKHGDQIRSAAEADGTTMELEVSSDKRSGLCVVCRDGNSRTLVVHPSSASSLRDDFVSSAAAQEGQRSAKTVYTTAYASVVRVRQTLQLMTSSRCHTLPDGLKQLAAMGLANQRVLDDFGEGLVDVLGKLDIIIGNPEEMYDLAMMLQWVPSEMSDMVLAKKIATEMMCDRHGVRRVIMTRGAEPIIYAASAGESGEVPVVATCAHSAKLLATGAGDAFAGGFLAAMAAKPDDVAFCCRLSAQAATFMINHSLVTLRTDEACLAELQT